MQNAEASEYSMPVHVSHLMRRNSLAAAGASSTSAGDSGAARISSTSSDACQKNRYGLIVVPNTPTIMAAAFASGVKCGTNVRSATCPQGTCTVNSTAA